MINLLAAIGNPGTGETNLRVLIASIVGRMRKAHGAQKAFRLERGNPVRIAGNQSQSRQTSYVAVAVRGNGSAATPTTAQVLFDSGQMMGAGTNIPTILTEAINTENFSFEAVLLPNEQLYAQLIDTAFAEVDIIVTQVFV